MQQQCGTACQRQLPVALLSRAIPFLTLPVADRESHPSLSLSQYSSLHISILTVFPYVTGTYSPSMRDLLSLGLVWASCLSSVASEKTFLTAARNEQSKDGRIEERQQPGVVAANIFLRRGYHSCKNTNYTARPGFQLEIMLTIHSRRCWQLFIHRWRRVFLPTGRLSPDPPLDDNIINRHVQIVDEFLRSN